MIIGSNKQKDNIVQQGMVPRLIQLIGDPHGSDKLKLEGQLNSYISSTSFIISCIETCSYCCYWFLGPRG